MSLIRVTDPAPLFAIEDVKKRLRVEDDDQDADLDAIVQAAVDLVDGPETWFGRCLAPQTWDWFINPRAVYGLDCWTLELPTAPIIAVDEVEYTAAGATDVALWTDYQVRGLGSAGGCWILPANGASWPSLDPHREVRIRFKAGYAKSDGESPPGLVEAVPFNIKAGLLLIAGELHKNRDAAAKIPEAAERLLDPLRLFR